MSLILTVIHVVACVILTIVVLLQAGKGAEISASFGGSSQTVFGSSGGANFFVRFTAVVAVIFFATSLLLTMMGSQGRKSLFEGLPATQTAPAVPTGNTGASGATTTKTAPAPTQPQQHQNAAPAEKK